MTKRLDIHYPGPPAEDTLEALNQQRVYDLIQVQSLIQDILDEIADKPHLDSFLLEEVDLESGTVNLVEHGLNRIIRGFKVVKQNANANIWEDEADESNRLKLLPLRSSAAVTVSLEVF